MTVKSQRYRIRWRNAEEPWTPVTESAYTAAGDLAMRATYTNGTEVVREFYAHDHDECIIENRKCIIAMGGIACPCRYKGCATVISHFPFSIIHLSIRVVSLRTTRDGGENWDETTWTYDVLTGLLLAKTYADGSQMTHTYTPDGLPTRTTYPGGKWKELVYDSNRNVTNILHTARSTPNTAFLHDAFGNVTNATDTSGNAWQFSYTHNSTLTNEVFTSLRLCDSARETNALARFLDAYSRPAGYDLAIGDTPRSRVRYGYDAEGRIATLAATNAANRGFRVAYLNEAGSNYGYTLTTPNGAILTRTVTRDPFRRSLTLDCTTRFNGVEVASFVYSFDAHNRPVTRNNDRFAYNDRDEILSAVIGTNRINHAYDTIGNHVFCAFNSETNFYANNQLNQTTASYRCAPTSVSDDATSQDEATPPLFDGYDILSTNKFTWSAQGGHAECRIENEQCKIASGGIAHTGGGVIVRFQFSILHLNSPLAPPLPIAHRTWCLQKRHDFVYDDWNLIHETITTVDANSTTNIAEVEYFWGPDLSNTLQGAGGVGGLLAVSMNGAFYFPVYDNLGNIVKYIDENGNIVVSYTYDDFGQMIGKIGPLASSFAFLFSTKYFDSEIVLYYYGCRFYSPLLHCWPSRDPIEENGGVNLFSYLENSCLDNIDPFGERVLFVSGGKNMAGNKALFLEKFSKGRKELDKILAILASVSDRQFDILVKNNSVRVDGALYLGTFANYKSLIAREKQSSVISAESFSDSLRDLEVLGTVDSRSYDWLVYGVQGRMNFVKKQERFLEGDKAIIENKVEKFVTVDYSDGKRRQDDILPKVKTIMRGALAHTIIFSCFQTWNGERDFKRFREWADVVMPKLNMPRGSDGNPCGINFIPFSVKKTIGVKP